MTSTTQISPERIRLNATALALAFGVAGLVLAVAFSAFMGGMWGTMGGAGWMHGSFGSGPLYGGSMMGGGFGFIFSAFCGLFAGALAGWVSASVYNHAVRRNA